MILPAIFVAYKQITLQKKIKENNFKDPPKRVDFLLKTSIMGLQLNK